MFQLLIGVCRLPFLTLIAGLMLLLAGMLTVVTVYPIDWQRFIMVFATALLAHIAVNAHNEYCDHISGLDATTQKTPFSGGSGTLQRIALSPRIALYFALACGLLCAGIGIYLMATSAYFFMLGGLGILGLILVFAYTPLINRSPWLCLIAPGLGFGIVIVYGGFLAVAQQHSLAALLSALAVAGLSNNLLLLNQFPDRGADAAVGRNHWVTDNTLSVCVNTYVMQFLLSLAFLTVSIWLLPVPKVAYLGLLPMLCGGFVAVSLYKLPDFTVTAKLLGLNVASTVLTPLMVGGVLCVVA